MNAAKVTLTATVLAAAFGLALGLSAAPAQAGVDCEDPKFFEHKQCGDTGGDGAGGGLSGKASTIVWTITAGTSLVDDDFDGTLDGFDSSYFHGDGGVRTRVGGQTQPHGPGIGINLRGTGQEPRTIRVNVNCGNPNLGGIIIGGVGGCNILAGLGVFGVQRAHMTLNARPYDVNCPDPEGGECLDVFTMGDGTAGTVGFAQMGFQIFADEGIRLDIASDIGGGDAPDPGRCLSIMTQAERTAFLNASCSTAADCNVTVTAMGVDSDGRNNSWDIVAANDTGLICRLFGEVLLIGVATGVSFTIEADPE
ncbi:MAG: hypothetical protein IH905_13990 [Proteobacteria bacterium]|nr:hypothetical protein [Pseudomonadota bacterium]